MIDFDNIVDDTCITATQKDSFFSKMGTMSYARPTTDEAGNISGEEAVERINEWVEHGLKLRGGKQVRSCTPYIVFSIQYSVFSIQYSIFNQ